MPRTSRSAGLASTHDTFGGTTVESKQAVMPKVSCGVGLTHHWAAGRAPDGTTQLGAPPLIWPAAEARRSGSDLDVGSVESAHVEDVDVDHHGGHEGAQNLPEIRPTLLAVASGAHVRLPAPQHTELDERLREGHRGDLTGREAK